MLWMLWVIDVTPCLPYTHLHSSLYFCCMTYEVYYPPYSLTFLITLRTLIALLSTPPRHCVTFTVINTHTHIYTYIYIYYYIYIYIYIHTERYTHMHKCTHNAHTHTHTHMYTHTLSPSRQIKLAAYSIDMEEKIDKLTRENKELVEEVPSCV